MCITYTMEVEQRASEGAYSMGGKRDMSFQARLFPDDILAMAQRNQYLAYPEEAPSLKQIKTP